MDTITGQTPRADGGAAAVHRGIFCDGARCESRPAGDNAPIAGVRYKCIVCADYDLCARCEAAGEHRRHSMLRIADPDDQSWRDGRTQSGDAAKVHRGVKCDGTPCKSRPHGDRTSITDVRYKCIVCADYDLCEQCEAAGEHRRHAMLRIVDPDDQTWRDKICPADAAISAQCPVCLDNHKEMVFTCGHGCCERCANRVDVCPVCRADIEQRIKLY